MVTMSYVTFVVDILRNQTIPFVTDLVKTVHNIIFFIITNVKNNDAIS